MNTIEMNTNIEPTNITTEMKNCYIDYAMSVIIGRALPDVRDGMKPVHRRILYAMHELGLTPDRPFRKSVRIVGDVLGKFHPHGDTAVYDAMVRMAQDFSMRYPTIDGHGNFGSIDGDGAAAMRYTEAKMNPIASEMLRDINKNTVDFIDNFDGSDTEPEVLTARFPHLLVNGSQGIAVGMATNMPPHNLSEVIDATILKIDKPEASVHDLMKKLPGPDFPTGGIIMGTDEIVKAYETGKGRIKIRGQVEIEKAKKGKYRIIITELPYMVNKAKLIMRIADLRRDKRVMGITDIRDESDLKHGMRIVIETSKGSDPDAILHEIYKHTDLESTFGIINLALVPDKNGKLYPKTLGLPQLLDEYISHQEVVIRRRTQFELDRAQKRAHLLEGLIIAVDHIDEVINIIRSSPDTKAANRGLRERFDLTEVQASAILDMRLQRLVGLEREKLKSEYEELLAEIKRLEKILSSDKEIHKVIKKELREIKKKYKDDRRTRIATASETKELEQKTMLPPRDVTVSVSKVGYVTTGTMRNIPSDDLKTHVYNMKSNESLLILTKKGKAYSLSVEQIPEVTGRGRHLRNLLTIGDNDAILDVFSVSDFEADTYVTMMTKNGLIKRTKLSEFSAKKKNGISALSLKRGDELVSAQIGDIKEVIVGTREGYAIRFEVDQITPTSRTASGIKAIKLEGDDHVIGMSPVKDFILTVTEDGYVKKTESKNYRKQARGGKGIRTTHTKDERVVALEAMSKGNRVLIRTEGGYIKLKDIPVASRTNKGQRLSESEIQEAVVVE